MRSGGCGDKVSRTLKRGVGKVTREGRIRNPYEVLGIDRKASAEELRKAYRKKAKALHPDLHPGDPEADNRFKELSIAWDILGDPERRARFDRGEIDAEGHELPPRDFYRDHAGRGGAYRTGAAYGDFGDASDIFAELFGRGAGRAGGARVTFPGADLHLLQSVDFVTAALGGSVRIAVPGQKPFGVRIPPGAESGMALRVPGRGEPGHDGGPPGDLILELSVKPHGVFRREGANIVLDLPISIDEAVLGAEVEMPTIDGRVKLKVPKGGRGSLRLRGKGARRRDGSRGDQIVRPVIVAPKTADAELEECVTAWRARAGEDPRSDWEGRA